MRGHIILANFPGGIDSIENLKSVFTIKNRTFDKTTAKGANPESLALRVEALKLEKWELSPVSAYGTFGPTDIGFGALSV
mgnify:CR=1 FL=1